MKKITFFLLIATFLWSCHTKLSCVDKHPENYINRQITVKGFAQDWLRDYHGYYFIVLSNRYSTHHLVIYKQIPNIKYWQRIKASGYLLKTISANNQSVYILVDTNNYLFSIKGETGKIIRPLRFRDTLPTLLWFER